MLDDIVIGDTCAIENLYYGNMLQWINLTFDLVLITAGVLVATERRVPLALPLINYKKISMTPKECELSDEILEISHQLFNKIDVTPEDASILAVAKRRPCRRQWLVSECNERAALNRKLPILSDNTGVMWFISDFLERDFKKEPYRSKRESLIKKGYSAVKTYNSWDIVLYLHDINILNKELFQIAVEYTAKSDEWLGKKDAEKFGIDWKKYFEEVKKEKKVQVP